MISLSLTALVFIATTSFVIGMFVSLQIAESVDNKIRQREKKAQMHNHGSEE